MCGQYISVLWQFRKPHYFYRRSSCILLELRGVPTGKEIGPVSQWHSIIPHLTDRQLRSQHTQKCASRYCYWGQTPLQCASTSPCAIRGAPRNLSSTARLIVCYRAVEQDSRG
jgi:hypothetical protein